MIFVITTTLPLKWETIHRQYLSRVWQTTGSELIVMFLELYKYNKNKSCDICDLQNFYDVALYRCVLSRHK